MRPLAITMNLPPTFLRVGLAPTSSCSSLFVRRSPSGCSRSSCFSSRSSRSSPQRDTSSTSASSPSPAPASSSAACPRWLASGSPTKNSSVVPSSSFHVLENSLPVSRSTRREPPPWISHMRSSILGRLSSSRLCLPAPKKNENFFLACPQPPEGLVSLSSCHPHQRRKDCVCSSFDPSIRPSHGTPLRTPRLASSRPFSSLTKAATGRSSSIHQGHSQNSLERFTLHDQSSPPLSPQTNPPPRAEEEDSPSSLPNSLQAGSLLAAAGRALLQKTDSTDLFASAWRALERRQIER